MKIKFFNSNYVIKLIANTFFITFFFLHSSSYIKYDSVYSLLIQCFVNGAQLLNAT